jgi:allantoin racemase
VPVLGIGECGMLTAMTLGQRIGVIAIARSSIVRHLRYFASMGMMGRVVRERSIDLSVAESTDRSRALSRMIETGLLLREDGADVLVMGCAGMADLRAAVEDGVGLPVVEPTQAAVGMAIGRLFGQP